jgi:hypothetical protein
MKAFMLNFAMVFGFKISNQEVTYLITRLTENEKEIHLLRVAQCLGSLNYKVITDVFQNLFLTKYDSFYHFLWREGILFTQKYNNNFLNLYTQFRLTLRVKDLQYHCVSNVLAHHTSRYFLFLNLFLNLYCPLFHEEVQQLH